MGVSLFEIPVSIESNSIYAIGVFNMMRVGA